MGLLQCDRLQPVFGQAKQRRPRIGHQDGEVRRDDDLAEAGIVHPTRQFQKFHLPRGRQRRFGFVENVEALAFAALFEKTQEALAMGMRQEVGRRAVADGGLIE